MTVNSKLVHHTRSKSSPIKPPPFLSQFNELLYTLQSSEDISISQPLICYKLNGLIQLHSNMCQLAGFQQDAPKEQNERVVEFLLDGSLWLIDVCGIVKDFLMQTREGIQRLLSVLRRKLDENEVVKEVSLYYNSRRIIKKGIIKSLRDTERFGKKYNINFSNEHQEVISFLCILEKSQLITVNVFKFLFSYVVGSRTLSEARKWSLLSKLIYSRQEPSKEEDCSKRNKFEVVDGSLQMLMKQKTVSCIYSVRTVKLRNQLEDLESLVLDLERSIECLCRLLIKTRVILLNTQPLSIHLVC